MSFAHTFGKLGLSNYYSQYFEALKLQKKTNDEAIDWDKVYDTYAGYEYLLRSRQLFDKADALEIIVDTVQEQVENAETQEYTELPHILYFLTKLADQSPVDSKLPKFSSEVEKSLIKKEFHKRQQPSTEEFFGTRISDYENAQRVNMDSPNEYFQYPAELFQEEPNQILKEDFIPTQIEHSEFNEFFKYGELTESTTPRPTFFGGLKPLSDNQVDDCGGFNINFEIPSLPEVPYSVFDSIPDESSKPAGRTYKSPKAATLPATQKHHEPSESLAQIFPQSLKNIDASTANTMIPNSWDTPALTQSNGLRPPYLSESDTRTFEVVYQKYFRGGNWEKSRSVVIETSAFMKALLNLVNGIVSRLFVYDQECRTFVFRVPHFRVQGLGTMGLHRTLQHFLDFGTRLRRLENVVNTCLSSPSTFGLSGVAFAHSLSSFLLFIREVLSSFESEPDIGTEQTILKLYYLTQDLSVILQWLSNICHCDLRDEGLLDLLTESQYDDWVVNGFYIPHGSHLLSHIYEKAHELDSSTFTLLRPLALSILSESSVPYFQFIDKWLRVDTFKTTQENPRNGWDNLLSQTNWDVVDPYLEFFIVNTDLKQSFLERDGDGYWEDGYQISGESPPPSFISNTLASEVLEAGKSLRLLNECRKNHPLYTDCGEYHDEGLDEFSNCSISLRWLFKIREIEEHQKLLMEHKRIMVSLIAQRGIERKLLLQKEIDQSREIRVQKKHKAEAAMNAMREERARRLKLIADKKEAYRKSIMDFLAEQKIFAENQRQNETKGHGRRAKATFNETSHSSTHTALSSDMLTPEESQSKEIVVTPEYTCDQEEVTFEHDAITDIVEHTSTLKAGDQSDRGDKQSESSVFEADNSVLTNDEVLSPNREEHSSNVNHELDDSSLESSEHVADDISLTESDSDTFGSSHTGLLTQKNENFVELLESLTRHGSENPAEDYIPPLSIINQHTIVHTLKRHCRLINSSVLSFFFHEMNLTGHLNVLRQYLLLGNGFYVNGIVQALFDDDANLDEFTDEHRLDEKAKISAIGFNNHFGWPLSGRKLNSALKAALLETISDELPLEFMDSTRVNEIKDLDDRLEFLTHFTGHDTSQIEAEGIEALDFIRVKYHAPHPLDVIITPTSISKYNQVFNFLLRVLRVDAVSRHIFRQTRLQHRQTLDEAGDLGYTQMLWKFRFEIHQFINAIRGYVFDYAVGATWENFSNVINKIVEENDFQRQYERYINANEEDSETLHIMDLRSLMEYHDMVLERILHRCFLLPNQNFIMSVITEIFELILELAQALEQDPDFSEISALYEEFKASREKLVAGLLRLEHAHPNNNRSSSNVGSQTTSAAISSHEYVDKKDGVTYIQEFLLRFDFSRRYMKD